jgi:FHS family L-fucose permease-like MFS transporter
LKINNISIVPNNLIIPFILVTSLFALWGFANAITDPMVQAFKKVLELSNSEAAWIQMAFYGGYFCMAFPAALFIKKYSYKKGILVGLALYAIGALLFYPAAVTEKFWFFCLGLYILTFGLAFLETTANPYILSMGNSKTAIQRLNLAQFFNPLGLITGLLVAQQFILKNLKSDDINDFSNLDQSTKLIIKSSDLIVIRDPYVILGLVVIGIFLLILFYKMPKSKKSEGSPSFRKVLNTLSINYKYIGGVLAQTLYVGAQIMCWTYIYQYAEGIGINSEKAADFQFIAFILFFIGRGTGTYLLKYISSAKLMMNFSLIAMLFSLGTIFIEGHLGLYCLVIISFFMSIMFPTIYGISLDGLNEDESKIGAAGLVMAIVGGAIMPKFQGMIIDIGGFNVDDVKIIGVSEINFSFILPLFCFIYISIYSYKILKNN